MLNFPAIIIGSEHRKNLINRQDALYVAENDAHYVGGVADGMGSGEQSEAIALLSIRFLVRQLLNIVTEQKRFKGNSSEYHAMGDKLYVRYQYFLEEQLRLQNMFLNHDCKPEDETFLDNYMMHTVVLTLVDKATGDMCVYSMGDGYLVLNPHDTKKSLVIDVARYFAPLNGAIGTYYASMNLSDYTPQPIKDVLVHGFNVTIYDTYHWDTMLIASDGLRDLLPDVEGYVPDPNDSDTADLPSYHIHELFQLDFKHGTLGNTDDLSLIYIINPRSKLMKRG